MSEKDMEQQGRGLGDAVRRIFEAGARQPGVQTIYEDEHYREVLITNPDGSSEREIFLFKPEQSHAFYQLSELVQYLKNEAGNSARVFVGENSIVAPHQYGTARRDKAYLELTWHEQWIRLQGMLKPLGQKSLWQLLVQGLGDRIEKNDLMLVVGSIQKQIKANSDVQIDPTGITGGGGSQQLAVTINGKNEQVPLEYEYFGPIFQCWPQEYRVPLRLTLEETERGLWFQFYPKNLEETLRRARLDIVEHLREEFKSSDINVYEARY